MVKALNEKRTLGKEARKGSSAKIIASPSRRLAFDILRRVETEKSYASDLLHGRLGGSSGRASPKTISQEDAALTTELVMGTLRWQRRLDYSIDAHLRHKKLDPSARIALRLGAYQILFLDRIPSHAAVNESVELVKRAAPRAAGLVNAVLRKLAAQGKSDRDLLALPAKLSAAERLGIRASHPTWLVERWFARYGEADTAALLVANNSPAPASITCLADSFAGFGFEMPGGGTVETSRWLLKSMRLRSRQPDFAASLEPLVLGGLLSYQDAASQMVAHLVEAAPGSSILDLCCAPGGKTILLARLAGPTGCVLSADLHFHRLSQTRDRLRPSALQPIAKEAGVAPSAPVALLALDATHPLPFSAQFNRILVDVPCSGTGTLARNPEIRWRLTPADLQDLAVRQKSILTNALAALAPGGRLVYSTCSLEPEENEQVVEAALAAYPDCHLADGRAALAPHLRQGADIDQLFDDDGYFRTFPPRHHTDGFFAAVIKKKQA